MNNGVSDLGTVGDNSAVWGQMVTEVGVPQWGSQGSQGQVVLQGAEFATPGVVTDTGTAQGAMQSMNAGTGMMLGTEQTMPMPQMSRVTEVTQGQTVERPKRSAEERQAVLNRERKFLSEADDEEKLARFYDYQEELEKAMMAARTPEEVNKIEATLQKLQGLMMDLKIRVGVA